MSGAGVAIFDPALADSRRFCEQLTREAAKNFYYGLKLLPEPKRSAMFALYAYMRLVDDIADEEDGRSIAQRLEELETWRLQTHECLAGRLPAASSAAWHKLWPAFADTARSYAIPPKVFDEVIAGQRQDLQPAPFEDFPQLYEYCVRVAGVVGIASIHIWGFDGGEKTKAMAIDRGVAFQLTNVLRDLREDAARGRTYLPTKDLTDMRVREEDLGAGRESKEFRDLMQFQIERAETYYKRSAGLEDHISPECRPTLIAMTGIYHGLLKKVAAKPQRVLRERVSLSLASKLYIGWRAIRRQ
jgi:phytoene synthase